MIKEIFDNKMEFGGENFTVIKQPSGDELTFTQSGKAFTTLKPTSASMQQLAFQVKGVGSLFVALGEIEPVVKEISSEDWVHLTVLLHVDSEHNYLGLVADTNGSISVRHIYLRDVFIQEEERIGRASKLSLYVESSENGVIEGLKAAIEHYAAITGIKVTVFPEEFDKDFDDIRMMRLAKELFRGLVKDVLRG